MEEQIKKLTHSLDVNSIFNQNDFAYSDKRIVMNKYGTPIVKIGDLKAAKPAPKTFHQIHFSHRLKNKKAELQQKIIKSTQGLSPISRRKVDKRDEFTQISPIFKRPRDTDTVGLDEILNVEMPFEYDRKRVLEEKFQSNEKRISKNYERHLSTALDFHNILKSIQNTLINQKSRSSPFKRPNSKRPANSTSRKSHKIKEDSKNKISLYDLEKKFMTMQKDTIQSYLKGETVDGGIVNKDFMSYILENFEEKARERTQIRRKIEVSEEREHSLSGKRFSYILRPSSAKINRIAIATDRPLTASIAKPKMSQSQTITNKIQMHHISVKQAKKNEKIEANKQAAAKIRESVISDLEGLGEVEKKALLKLRKKFVLYNNTNYEVLEHDKMKYLHRNEDLKTKNFLVMNSEKFSRTSRPPPSKVMKENMLMFYQSARAGSLGYFMQGADTPAIEEKPKEKQSEIDKIRSELNGRSEEQIDSDERHLNDLKQFKRKIQVRPLTAEEAEFFQNIKKNEYNAVYFALIARPDLLNITDNMNQTPLHWVAKRGLYELACLFCEFDPNYQAKDSLDRTPLQLAEACGQTQLAKLIESKEGIIRNSTLKSATLKRLQG